MEKRGPKLITNEKFIEKAKLKHGNKYDYSLVNYINANTKVKIICLKHGIFEQQPNNHIWGQGCIRCMSDRVSKARKYTKEQWINKFREKHGNRYDYSKFMVFNGSDSVSKNKIIIICKKHGEFLQTPNSHMSCGCPHCNISKGEDEIEKYLISNGIEYIREYKFKNCINPKTNKKLPFDFYLLNFNLIIEYHGEQHYKKMGKYFENRAGGLEGRQFRDKIKKEFCLQNNIDFLEINYKEFNNINLILINKL
jgi:hypothetical protein